MRFTLGGGADARSGERQRCQTKPQLLSARAKTAVTRSGADFPTTRSALLSDYRLPTKNPRAEWGPAYSRPYITRSALEVVGSVILPVTP